jgi:hypothetical protein
LATQVLYRGDSIALNGPRLRSPEIPGDRILFHRLMKNDRDQLLKKN